MLLTIDGVWAPAVGFQPEGAVAVAILADITEPGRALITPQHEPARVAGQDGSGRLDCGVGDDDARHLRCVGFIRLKWLRRCLPRLFYRCACIGFPVVAAGPGRPFCGLVPTPRLWPARPRLPPHPRQPVAQRGPPPGFSGPSGTR